MTRSLAGVLSLLLLSSVAQAKDLQDWSNLAHISRGQKVQITRKSGTAVRGRFAGSTEAETTVDTDQGSVSVRREEVGEIGKKGRNTAKWIGTAVGAVGGALVGNAVGKYLYNEGHGDEAAVTAVGTAAGAGLGFLVGFGIDAGYKTVYRSR